MANRGGFKLGTPIFGVTSENNVDTRHKHMDDKFLKTTIFIIKNKVTKKPIVITHFEGFRDKADAEDFSTFIKQQFVLEEEFDNQNKTLH